MRQPTLWTSPEDLARAERWEGLGSSVRADVVAHLLRIVVHAVTNRPEPPDGEGEHGLEGATEPPRT